MKRLYIVSGVLGVAAILTGGALFAYASGTEAVLSATNSCTGGVYGTGVYGIPYGQYSSDCTVSSQKLILDKEVKNPKTGDYTDNLFINDDKFSPEQTMSFRVKVTNSGNNDLTNIAVSDILPDKTAFVSGNGNYDSSSRTLKYTIDTLHANETKTWDIQAKAPKASDMSDTTTCLTNQATASVNGINVQDNAQFCVQKNVLGMTKGGTQVFAAIKVTKTPATGAEAFSLFALIPTSLSGLFLRKRASK